MGFLSLVLVGCGNKSAVITVSGDIISDTQIADGKEIYVRLCAECHGVNGEGQFPNSPTLPDATGRIGAPPHNGNGHTWHHGDKLLIRYVLEGGMGDPAAFYPMPAFADQLTEEQVIHITAYLKTLWNDEQRLRQQQATELEDLR